MRRYLSLCLFLTLVFPGVVLATSFVMVPDEAMVDQAPLVIEGTVISGSLAEMASGLSTVYQVEIVETLKGTATGQIVSVRVPGGVRPNGTGFQIWGAPSFAVGEQALFFLTARPDGTYDLVQLMLGVFKEKEEPGGRKVFRRDFAEAREVTPDGRPVPPGREKDRRYQEFKGWVKSRAKGQKGAQDYFVEPQTLEGSGEEGELQSITAPYAFFTYSGNGLKIRWFTFDGGGSASWRANFSGLPAVAGTRATEVQNAVNAWTNDAGSKVNYSYAGTTASTAGFTSFDGINSVLFEDPNNFISGSFNCVSGGIIAQGGPWFSGTQSFNGETYNVVAGADVIVQDGASCYLTGHTGKDGEETYAHELGHTLGLGHSAVGDALMNALAHADGRGAQLQADDQAGIAILYPNGGGGGGNTPPTISDITNRTINEDGTTGVINFTVDDAETAAGSLGVSGSSSNQSLVPNGNIVFGGSGGNRTVTVTPVGNQNGSATITVTVSDGQASDSDTFLLTVNAVNDPPSIANIPNQTTAANQPKGPISFTVSDIDNPVGSLTLSGTSSNQALVPNGNISFGGNGGNRTVTVTPAAGQSGSAIITVTVSDGSLNASDPFTLTVTPPPEPPVISTIPNQTIDEDQNTGAIPFTVSDPDTPLGSLTLSGSSSNQSLVPNGSITFGGSAGNRTVTVTPAHNATGTATITVTVSDGTSNDSTPFTVTVQGVPDPPTITDIPNQTIAVNTNTGAIPFTIADPDTAVGSLQLSATSFNTNLVPTANITFGGSGGSRNVTVTPAAGETGVASIRVTVSDGSGSDISQFNVTVTGSGGGGGGEGLVLSYPDGDTGIPGVRRQDGGNDANNLAPANPRLGIDYIFQVKLTDPSGQPPAAMKLILNGVGYNMSLASGTPATGAVYNFTTQLGPKALHTFHFEARDGSANILDRLPENGENNGPQVQLLNGANMVGISKNLGTTSINAVTAFDTANAYRWISAGLSTNVDQGGFQLVDQSGSVEDGEAYFILRNGSPATLPNLSFLADNTNNTVTYQLQPGWNLISLPYEGRLQLGQVQVRRNAASAVSWLQAASNGWVVNAAYYFNGSDWGGTYSFLTDQGVLVSWLGYWIYLAKDDATYSLVFTKPGS